MRCIKRKSARFNFGKADAVFRAGQMFRVKQVKLGVRLKDPARSDIPPRPLSAVSMESVNLRDEGALSSSASHVAGNNNTVNHRFNVVDLVPIKVNLIVKIVDLPSTRTRTKPALRISSKTAW